MKCPVCKKEIPDNSIICPECNSRIGLVCHNCNTVNPLNTLKCKNCGAEILKLCPNCRAINLPTAVKCRKCGAELKSFGNSSEDITSQISKPAQDVPKIRPTRPEIIELLYNAIIDDEKSIISLSGAKAMGKDYVVNNVVKRLEGIMIMRGTGSPVSQLTAGGFLQELLLSFFGLPNFCIINTQFEKDAVKFFKHTFPSLNNDEIIRFINFLYPHKTGGYEEIIENKAKTFNLMNKVFEALCSERKVLIIMDNFDYIDALSYEFFGNFLKNENVLKNVKFLMTYSENRPAQSYFYLEPEKYGNIYLNLDIAPMTPVEAVEVFKSVSGINKLLPDVEKKELFKKSKGNPAYIKSGISYKQECLTYGLDYKLPLSFEDLLKKRLETLKIFNPLAFDMLACASIIGKKINTNLLREVFDAHENVYDKAVEILVKSGYWIKTGEFFFEFENSSLWEVVFTMAKEQPDFIELNKKLFSIMRAFTLSSNTLLAIILQNIHNKRDAFDVWTRNVNLASYIGDINLYVISQKQCLALINEFDDIDTLNIRFNISERIGKLLAYYNPSDALDYLPDAISNAQGIGDSVKEIELLSYMTDSCQKTGKYFGVVESTDRVLAKIKPEKNLEIALVKAAKLEALLAIGNCGEIINLVNNEILPVFNKYMNGVYKRKDIPWELLFNTRLNTYLILANAYVLQGNKKAYEIMALIFNMIERGQVKDQNVIVKSHLVYALLNTVCGDYSTSNRHLQEIMDAETRVVLNNQNILDWNFINIINRFLNKEYEHIQEDLFEIVAFANNNRDEFTKNIMKSLLGKFLVDNEQIPKGLEIYNEQLEYFSNSKIALGALLCWFLISDTIMVTDSSESAVDIAQKALNVALSPKIDNYNFQIYLRIVLAKAFIAENDFDTARIHLDEGLKLSQENDLNDLTARLYLTYGRLYEEVGFKKSSKQVEFLKMSDTMFERSMKYIRKTQNNYLFRELTKSQKVLKSFCEMNKINFDK